MEGIFIALVGIMAIAGTEIDFASPFLLCGILVYLNKAYKMRKSTPSTCWKNALKYIYITLGFYSLCNLLEGANNHEIVIKIAQVISCSVFALLIYFIQIAFNFIICDLEYTNKNYTEYWQKDLSFGNVFSICLSVLSCLSWVIFLSSLTKSSAEKLGVPVIRFAVFCWGPFLWHISTSKWIKDLNEEISANNE